MRRPVIIVAIAGTFVVALLASVLTTPWWTGGAIAAIGSRFGLTFASYEAEGYRTFTLRDVRYERRGVRVTVDHVQSAGVLRWGWRRLTGKPTEVVAGRWSVDVQPTPNAPRTQTPRGWVPLRAQLVRTADLLERWLPAAKVGEGVVSWPKGQLALSSAEWTGRVLRSPEVSFRSFKAAVDVSLPASGALAANVSAANGEGSLALHSVGADLSGAVEWWEQNAKLAVHFAETGWMPREAELDAPQWEIPARRVKLGGQYAVLRGRGEVVWREGKLTADIGVEGVPLPEAKAPPLTVVVRGRGEDGAFRAEQLQIDLPGIVARLSDPLAIDRRGRVRSGPAGFTLRAELGRLPWLAARGVVEGTGTIAAGADDMARVEFALGADEIDVAGVALKRLESGGLLEWPRLTLNKGRLVSPGGEELAFKGGWDFRAREVIAAEVQGRVGADLIGRRMPAGLALDALTVELKAQGPLAALTHEGRVDASNVRMPKLRPMAIRADWRGRWDQLEHFSAAVAAGASRLTAAGSASRSAVELQQFALERNDAALLRLAQPASVRWAPSLQVEGVRLDGAEAHLHATLQWAKAGHIDVSARGVRPEWFSDFVQLPQSMWTVDTVAVKGAWNDSPAEYEASATGWINVGDDKTARLSAQVKGSAGGVEVTTFDVSEGGGAIAHATGHLPFVIRPAGKPFFQLDEDATLSLDATTSPNPEFWRNITELTGVELIEPSVDVHLSGSWRNPRGDARLSARSLAAVSGRFQGKWPKIDALHAHLVGLNDGVRLEAFTLNVEGQAVRAEGWLPLSLERWREIREDPRNLARSGDLRLQVPDADLAALAQYFPSILAPRGRLQLDVTLKSDATLTGFLQVRNATSRPLG
ncbi:MAG TPA: hypothetical protein VEQ65_09365, partial [Opitutus sp.]|nr:hypothetical protein [Opitutus sp.]